jgi:glycosyltransferase involved in cell wall biosynthesis
VEVGDSRRSRRDSDLERESENVNVRDGVSIVVPCYNGQTTLAATIESALAENCVSDIVVVDDGSGDGSLAIARSFEPHVRVLSGPNRGVSRARNWGIAETLAEWLIFLDADDLLLPGTVPLRLEAAKKTGANVVICDWEDLIDDGNGAVSLGPRRSVDWLALVSDAEVATATDVWATTAALMYHRPLVERMGGFRIDLPVIQDARFLFDAAYQGGRFVHSPHVGAHYRVHSGSLSRRNPAQFWQDVLLNGQQIEALWRARGELSASRCKAVYDIYSVAARGLLEAAHPKFFDAVRMQRAMGVPLPRLSRLASLIARLVGVRAARKIVTLALRA